MAALFTLCLAADSPAAGPDAPRPAPAQFVSGMYGITFPVPEGAYHCPLPEGWVGSDHGTIIFLERPESCGGAGYPSSSRGFAPGDVPRIAVYYGFSMRDIAPENWTPPPCRKVGSLRFLRELRPVCADDGEGLIVRSVSGHYPVGPEAEAVLTLVTRPGRLEGDMAALRRLAARARTCSLILEGKDGPFRQGEGAPCPPGARHF